MTNIGVIKGQPFRYGTFDGDSSVSESTTIHFLSDASLEQSKSAPPISRVRAKDTFLSVDLALCKVLCEIYSDPLEEAHAAGLWTCISPKENTVVFVNRHYLINQVRQILPKSMDDARKTLECRRLLSDLESAWNTSILQPDLIPALFCAHGWNAKTKTLYTMPYRPLPIGRVESVGGRAKPRIESQNNNQQLPGFVEKNQLEGTSGLVYKSDAYPDGSFDLDLTTSESILSNLSARNKIYLIYIDSFAALKSNASWPDLLTDNISEELSHFIMESNVLVVDLASRVELYTKVLRRHLMVDSKPFDHALPCCSFRNQDILAGLRIDILSSSNVRKTTSHSLSPKKDMADLNAFTRAFKDLYPAYEIGENLPSAVIGRAFNQFGYSLDDQPLPLVLSGRAEPPNDLRDPSLWYLGYGQLRVLLERLIGETSQRLLIRRSDLVNVNLDRIQDSIDGISAWLIRVSLQADLVQTIGLDWGMTLNILRGLSLTNLENPYKLAKRLDMQKIDALPREDRLKLTIIVLEDC